MKYLKQSIAVILAVLYAYLYAATRTTRVGFSLKESLVFFVLMVATTVLVVTLMGKRVTGKIALIILGAVFVLTCIGEAYAGIQEWQVLSSHGRDCKIGAYIERWKPFSNHGIYCGESGAWVGND